MKTPQVIESLGALAHEQGRRLIYSADFDAMNGLVGYLTEN